MAQDGVLQLAAEVTHILTTHGEEPVVIGAVALAAHGYVRATEDVDLGLAVSPQRLAELAEVIRQSLVGVQVSVEAPTPDDPLGGVIDIWRHGEGGDHVQVVNFDNSPGGGFPALVRDAHRLPFEFSADFRGWVVSPEDLVFFKLYAGGPRNSRDILELLDWASVDRERLRELARRYRMERQLQQLLDEARA